MGDQEKYRITHWFVLTSSGKVLTFPTDTDAYLMAESSGSVVQAAIHDIDDKLYGVFPGEVATHICDHINANLPPRDGARVVFVNKHGHMVWFDYDLTFVANSGIAIAAYTPSEPSRLAEAFSPDIWPQSLDPRSKLDEDAVDRIMNSVEGLSDESRRALMQRLADTE